MKKLKNIDLCVAIISLVVISFTVGYLAIFPESGTVMANLIFKGVTDNLGTGFLWFGFLSLIACIVLAFTKYGDIRLGQSNPEYSTFSWIAMMICAGIGSATVYWAFNEWAFYYMRPPYGVEAYSNEAAEWAITYNLFHWGFTAWALYALTALPIAYAYHVRRNSSGGLKLSSICEVIFGEKLASGPLGKIVDIIFIFGAVGGLGITLGLSIPLVSGGLSELFGIEDTFTTQVIIVLIISILYSFSSYLGLEKGMRRMSDLNIYFVIVFVFFIFIVGPTRFIVQNTTNSIGKMLQNYVQMSLWTDPINKSGFPEAWTIFYWAYWLAYTPFMGLFITKISKGRKIKEVIFNMLLAGCLGTFIFFGVIGNYSMNTQLTGKVDVTVIINTEGGSKAAIEIMKTLPFSTGVIVFFLIITVLFLATTLDSASFTMATTTSKKLDEYGNPSPFLRLFWCMVLSMVPLSMMFIGAPLKTIQTSAFVVTVPLIVVLFIMIVVFFRWIIKDYGCVSEMELRECKIRKEKKKKPEDEKNVEENSDKKSDYNQ